MTSTVIFNNFKAPDLWRNKYRRSTYEIWDANLHHGDVRPFACPEFICGDSFQDIHPVIEDFECDCSGFNEFTPTVKGFHVSQNYAVINERLRHLSNFDICNQTTGDLAGAPTPPVPISSVAQDCDQETVCDSTGVSYVITYVVEHSNVLIESAPSPPTIPISVTSMPGTTLSWLAAPVAFADYNIVATRLYRLESSFEDGTDSMPSHGSEYVFVREFNGSGAINNHIDNVPSSATGGPLTTYEPMAFPAPTGLVSVARTSDGLVVADLHRVYISESGTPQFTFDGVIEIEDAIQHIVAINNTVFVFTDNKPVKIAYQHTDGVMSIDKQVIQRNLPLKSKESVSVYGGAVYFSSTYSLYSWNTGRYGSDIKPIFTSIMSPEQWRNIDPSSVVGTAYEFGYIFTSDSIEYSLMVEIGGGPLGAATGPSVVPISYINPNAFATDRDGHIIYSDNTGTYRWDWRRLVGDTTFNIQDNTRPSLHDQCECCPWKIGMYFDNEGKNRFSRMRVEWDEQSATSLDVRFFLKAFGEEDELTDTLKVINSRGFSIPKFCSAQTFCVEVSGCGIMHEIRLATSSQELVSNSNNLIGNSGDQ